MKRYRKSTDQSHKFKLPDTALDLDRHPNRLELATAHYDGHVRITRMTVKG